VADKKRRKRHVQLTLDQARKPTGHGGWRPGAGRKKKPGSVSHAARATVDARQPQHVTVRLVEGAPSIARGYLMRVIRTAIAESHKPTFRVVEFNVLGNHLHFLIEAAAQRALACGMQGLLVRLSRRLNAKLGRTGKLFATRYHARALATPREVRHAIRYVLLNRRHHQADKRFDRYWLDTYSSAPWFTGWADPARADRLRRCELGDEPRPTAEPATWLLRVGWKQRLGPLGFDERLA
jgi:REP element-mobilizing transposase RayT